MCSLRDAGEIFEELGVVVYGISLDSVATQKKFATEQKLNFSLLSDPDGSGAGKYQVLREGASYPSRVTFIIDPEGKLRAIDRSVKVAAHGMDLVERVAQLQE